ncbi:MAG: hypothetical protein H7A42_09925 [Chlamydiales bacterium]|nr:hypothetical protein [Chlamydiales bacterium]
MLKDVNQNFWQLASIQGASLGLQGLLLGKGLEYQYGTGVAITSLCIGNFILWIIGLTMFSMTYNERGKARHALENVVLFFGKPIAILAAIMLMMAFISWFPLQMEEQNYFLNALLLNYSAWNEIVGIVVTIIFALIIIMISTFGIRMIKWVCTTCFPFFVLYLIYALFKCPSVVTSIVWKFSFQGTILSVLVILPGVINLPTFFRHAKSRADGVLALSIITIFNLAFQVSAIYAQFFSDRSELFAPYLSETGWTFNLIVSICFISLVTLCVNLVNIYYASVAIELVVPNLADTKGYTLIGLIGILAIELFANKDVIKILQVITNNFIGSLGFMLLIGCLSRILVKHRFRYFELSINVICWFIGCIVSLFVFILGGQITESFLSGILALLVVFLCILFIEEFVWSYRKIKSNFWKN